LRCDVWNGIGARFMFWAGVLLVFNCVSVLVYVLGFDPAQIIGGMSRVV
jgi:hypothetical protein